MVSIRKSDEEGWYHFRRTDWQICKHISNVQRTIGSHQFADYPQIPISVKWPINVLEYYDAINNQFFFNDCVLEKFKLKS